MTRNDDCKKCPHKLRCITGQVFCVRDCQVGAASNGFVYTGTHLNTTITNCTLSGFTIQVTADDCN